jgi:PAS domain S-box-containing protein
MASDQPLEPGFINRWLASLSFLLTSERPKWVSIFLTALLVAILSFLLVYNYKNLTSLQTSKIEKLFLDVEEKSKIISYFIGEREKELTHLASTKSLAEGYFTSKKLGMTDEYGLKGIREQISKKFAELNSPMILGLPEIYCHIVLFTEAGEVVVEFKGAAFPADKGFEDKSELGGNQANGFRTQLVGREKQYLRLVAPIGNSPHYDGYIVGRIAVDTIFNTFISEHRADSNLAKEISEYYVLQVNDRSAVFVSGQKVVSQGAENSTLPDKKFALPVQGDPVAGWRKIESDFFGNAKTIKISSSLLRDRTLQLVYVPHPDLLPETTFPLLLTFLFASLSAVVLCSSLVMYKFLLRARISNVKLQDSEQRRQEILEINTVLQKEVKARENAEFLLHEEKAFLQSLITAIPDQIYFQDSTGKFLGCNSSFECFWGTKLADWEKAGDVCIDEFLHIQSSKVVNAGVCIQSKHWVEDASGNRVFLESKKTPIVSHTGSIIGMISVSRDRTTDYLLEMEVAKQRQRLEMIFNATRIGIWDWDVQSGALYINDRWAEIAGYSLAELSPVNIDTWMKLVHPDDLQESNSLITKHFNKETSFYACELRIRHKSGAWVWINDRGQVVQWSENGMPLRMSGVHIDISEKKVMEQRLSDSEKNFRIFFESLGDMIFVCDPLGRIVFSNPSVKKKLEYDDVQLRDMTILDLHPTVHRQAAEGFLSAMLEGTLDFCSLPLVSRSGKEVPVESRIWFGQWNGAEAIYGISKDLRKEQEALYRFERLFRKNPVAMAISSTRDRTFIDINDAFVDSLGYARHEVIGRSAAQLGFFLERETVERTVKKMGRDTSSFSGVETQVRSKNGDIIDGVFSGEFLSSQDGDVLLTAMVNITPIKNADRELRISNETLELRVEERTKFIEQMHEKMILHDKMAAVGQLAAGVAHELNNPINFITTNFNVLNEYFTDFIALIKHYREYIDSDDQVGQAYLRKIEEDVRLDFILKDIPVLFDESDRGFERVAKIISSMRNFSYVDHQEVMIGYDINTAIEDTLIIAINSYKYHAVVNTDLGRLSPLFCYPELLKQVFLNLLINSAQAIEMQGRKGMGLITIRTWQDGENVICEFADDGPGIPESLKSLIFEPFFTTKPPGVGVGLGLSICYDIIVVKHKGELVVTCPESGGTIFTLRLPINPSH